MTASERIREARSNETRNFTRDELRLMHYWLGSAIEDAHLDEEIALAKSFLAKIRDALREMSV